MSKGYMYEIYDTVKKEWLPGVFQSIEVRKMLGIRGSIAERAKDRVLIRQRYKVSIAGEWTPAKDTFPEEWDAARMKLLRTGDKMAAEPRKRT